VITFKAPPERVVTIVRSAPIIYRAIDEKADNIVGMNKDSLVRYFTSGIYAEMLSEMAKINASAAKDGFVPNVEAILAEKPDAVIQWTHDAKIIEPLERVGLTVVGWQCCTEQDRLDYLTITGYMTGRNDRAQAILKAQSDTLKALSDKVAKLNTAALPSVLHIDKVADQEPRDHHYSGLCGPQASAVHASNHTLPEVFLSLAERGTRNQAARDKPLYLFAMFALSVGVAPARSRRKPQIVRLRYPLCAL